MTDSDPPDSGTADGSVESGADAIASLLFPSGQDEQTGTDARDPKTDTAEADAEASDEVEPDEGDESDTDSQADEDEPEPKYRLADGTEVTRDEIEEWRRGSLRQADYTRKTTELADSRKAVEASRAELTQKSETFNQRIDLATELLKANLPQEPDLALLQSDPMEYVQQKAIFDQRREQLQRLIGAKQQHEAEIGQQRAAERQQYLTQEMERLGHAWPEFADPEKRKAVSTDLVNGLQTYGFTPQELGDVADHRMLLVARDAIAYRKLMAKKPKADAKAKDAPPVQKPGRRPGPQEAEGRPRKERMERLRKSGSIQDGADVLEDILGLSTT